MLSRFSAGQRQAVLAFYWQGLTHAEAALELGTTPGAVKARLHKARAALAPQLSFYSPFVRSMTSEGEPIMIEVEVSEVRRAIGEDTTRSLHVIVLKERGGTRLLPIYTGSTEAVALACTMEAVEMPRPLSYQMAASLVSAAGSSGHRGPHNTSCRIDFLRGARDRRASREGRGERSTQ